ncbi:uncharacterized protein LOC141639955, partial [Silene latifolia]|uniref:uncharacterized protein LOC141639955 n=1 Tax=Silene latifolia TaxID=37657 RepID=UPI003D788FAB
MYYDTAKEVWEEIVEMYEQFNGAQLYHVHSQINDIAQGSDSVSTYYTKLRKSWEELRSIWSMPICKCGCTCGAYDEIIKHDQIQRLIKFLMGLNDSYKTQRGNILMMDPLLTINVAYSLIIQEEKQREIASQSPISLDNSAMAARSNERCYILHPELRKKKMAAYTQSYETQHKNDEGKTLHGNPHMSQPTASEKYSQIVSNFNNLNKDSPSPSEKYAMMAGITNNSLPWILDSGASDHITPHLHLFKDYYKPMSPCEITIPNGNKVKVPALTTSLTLGKAHNGLYLANSKTPSKTQADVACAASSNSSTSLDVWHCRLGFHRLPFSLSYSKSDKMFEANLPINFWGDCILTATYLINRLPSTVLNNKTPYEVLYKQSPSYTHLRAFGYLCFAATLKRNRDKFQPMARPCVLLGYPYGKKAYTLLDLNTKNIFHSRDVKFHEDVFPFHTEDLSKYFPTSTLPCPPEQHLDPIFFHHETTEQSLTDDQNTPQTEKTLNKVPQTEPQQELPQPELPLKTSSRTHKLPSHLKDYELNLLSSLEDYHFSGYASGTHWGNMVQFKELPNGAKDHIHHILSYTEPTSYNEAATDPQWVQAMQTELDALQSNNTWVITDLPKGKK